MKLILLIVVVGGMSTGLIDDAIGVKFVEGTTLAVKMAHWGIYLLWGAAMWWAIENRHKTR